MIAIQGLRKSFGDLVVLDGVDLEVKGGQTVVVLGRSGTGKSVLLKHIVGLMRPDAGEVWVEGEEVAKAEGPALDSIRKKVGFLFQSAALYDSMTVGENLSFPLKRHTDMEPKGIAARVEELLTLVGLPGIAGRMPSDLSGGMRKRVGLARAMALRPKIMLYDEPTTGLDPETSHQIGLLINKLRDDFGITAISITHDLPNARLTADAAAFLHQGKIIAHGPAPAFYETDHEIVRRFLDAEHGDGRR